MKSSKPLIHQRNGIRLSVNLVESLLAQLGITPPLDFGRDCGLKP